jgi:hypothetical protein
MTPYDIKSAAHQVALEATIIAFRRGDTVVKMNPSQIGKAFLDVYRTSFGIAETFLRRTYGYSTD